MTETTSAAGTDDRGAAPDGHAYRGSDALIVVDVQNDFADPDGTLHVAGGEEVVGVANREIGRAADGGALVVYTQDWHPARTPHFATDGGPWPPHCVRDSWGAQFASGLRVVGPVVRKGVGGEDGYSGFTVRDPAGGRDAPTGLADLLTARGVDRVVLVGLATDHCVRATALDAVRAGFATVVVVDGVRAVDLAPDDGASALAEMRAAGVELV
jgi:nicotinamidase/pyrazinamidase